MSVTLEQKRHALGVQIRKLRSDAEHYKRQAKYGRGGYYLALATERTYVADLLQAALNKLPQPPKVLPTEIGSRISLLSYPSTRYTRISPTRWMWEGPHEVFQKDAAFTGIDWEEIK